MNDALKYNEINIEECDANRKITIACYNVVKRLFDIFVSVIGLLILLPIALFVKIAYLLNGDKASIFYTQKRIGKDGKFIYIYKFRSMVPNADKILFEFNIKRYK